jgi:hypothetical protein
MMDDNHHFYSTKTDAISFTGTRLRDLAASASATAQVCVAKTIVAS